jgi:hypothetical protein
VLIIPNDEHKSCNAADAAATLVESRSPYLLLFVSHVKCGVGGRQR